MVDVKETIFERTFKLIKEILIPLAHQNYHKNPQIVLKPFHETADHLFISLEIDYTYFIDLQDLSETLAEYGFVMGTIAVNGERVSIEIQSKAEEEES